MSQAVEQTWVEWAKTHYTAEGEARGALRNCRENLRLLLENHFGPLPTELVALIGQCDDLDQLQACFAQALTIHSLDELRL